MGKRSGAGHYNQTRRSWTCAKHKRACAYRLQQPHYVHLRLDTRVLEIELRPPVPIRDAASAFERFRGWLIRTVRPTWPNVRLEPHSTKPSGAHLHEQRWRLWIDQSNRRRLVLGFTSHLGGQRFYFQGAPHLLRLLRDLLFPVPDYSDLVAEPQWHPRDEDDPPPPGDDPPLLPYVQCS